MRVMREQAAEASTPIGMQARARKLKMRFSTCFKISGSRHCQIIKFWGDTSLYRGKLCFNQSFLMLSEPHKSV